MSIFNLSYREPRYTFSSPFPNKSELQTHCTEQFSVAAIFCASFHEMSGSNLSRVKGVMLFYTVFFFQFFHNGWMSLSIISGQCDFRPSFLQFINNPSRDRRLPLLLNWILPSSGLLRSVGWCRTDVSGLLTGPIFKSQVPKTLNSWKWDLQVLSKRRF